MQIKVYKTHPEGVVMVKFKEEDAAKACMQTMQGRWFGGRQVQAAMWDGTTNYQVRR